MDTDGQTGGRTRPNLLPSTRSVTSISALKPGMLGLGLGLGLGLVLSGLVNIPDSDRSVDTHGGRIGAAAWRVTEYLLHGTPRRQADVHPLQTHNVSPRWLRDAMSPPALAISGGGHDDQWV